MGSANDPLETISAESEQDTRKLKEEMALRRVDFEGLADSKQQEEVTNASLLSPATKPED
jgi:hypothetical protein